ncbi:hypothetical protein GCM10009007_03400 [Formosimonas limnophila]|uniref:Uncharacterized protein n=1 Tax=Formosimonas limnophila TaxID=1384487 RepID=A0A8J3CFU0_9BURK|nr:hypothetical protein [Formosimonas limnophila]GHA66257.1 hypothetical protein GCM10009007_03400 [Formosimonas limnophila]
MKKVDHSKLIIENLSGLNKVYKVGFPEETTGGQKYENGATVAQVAAWQEYGTKKDGKERIPPRPFMKNAADEFDSEPNKVRDALQAGVVKNPDAASDLLRLMLVGKIKDQISRGSFIENDKQTVKKKGSSRPLIDTGKMLGSVDFVEVKK